MSEISKITLPNGKEYDFKDTTARNAANSAVPNTRTVNGKALSSDISLGAGDVGLGSVANLDQSKAIKSITRNGTTFTATALDGTTSTFTQQDTNTTYGVATSSADGLMSKSDKAKLDGIGAGSNVKSVNGKTGAVNLSKADVGLGNVDNTRDADKHVLANNIQWGGNNIVEDIDPISAAMSDLHSANRLAFCDPKGILVEYSTDGGTTWLDSGATDIDKTALVSGLGHQFWFGNVSSGTPSTNDQLRITIDAVDCQIYCQVKTILIEYNTSSCGGSSCKIEIAYNRNVSVFSDIGTYNVEGWSGWNSIPVNLRFGTATQAGNVRKVRLTFSFKSVGSSPYGAPNVRQIKFYGSTSWWFHSNMGNYGHLYSYDANQNATFPAKVTATSFSGATATSSADGLMSKSDKSKLDGIGAGSNVKSVNSKTGAVTLTKSDIGLSNVDNTADSAKSVKYATSAGSANSVAWGNVSGRPSSLPANGGNSSTVNGHTVNADVPSGAKFTDTVTTVTTTGSGNAVTAISASNGALTVTKDATFATKQESSNHVIASKTQPSNQQAGDIWIIIK